MKKTITLIAVFMVFLSNIARAEDQNILQIQKMFPIDSDYIVIDDAILSVDDIINIIAQHPQLNRLDIFQSTLETEEFELLNKLYPNVQIGCILHLCAKHYLRTDAQVFSTLHGNCHAHTYNELRGLQYCKELRALDLGHNNICNIDFLKPLTKLRVLILACNQDLSNIDTLSNLEELEYIELFSTNIRKLDALSELPHLMDLNIAYNKISRLDPIFSITTLKRLWISDFGGDDSDNMVIEYQKKLPNTTIMNHGHPTAYGWRDIDPHYITIYTMFNEAHYYIPFEDSWQID